MGSERISFTETEVAEMTGLKVKTLQRWRLINQGPPFVRLGRCVRYMAADLESWIRRQPSGGAKPIPFDGSINRQVVKGRNPTWFPVAK